jgi:hypothetical protein
VALYTVWYNFVKQHKSIKGLSPAMAAGVSKTPRDCRAGKKGDESATLHVHPKNQDTAY